MKKSLLIFFIFHFLSLIFVPMASAHTLKTDGSVGAVLHVSPDDDPVAGVNTDFFFDLKDTNNVVSPENCTCVARVLQNGKEIYSQSLFQTNATPSLEDASFSYTLPQKDIYTVEISGNPKNGASFEPFTLAWDIRVARDAAEQNAASENTVISVLPSLIILTAVIIFVGIIFGKKKKKHNA